MTLQFAILECVHSLRDKDSTEQNPLLPSFLCSPANVVTMFLWGMQTVTYAVQSTWTYAVAVATQKAVKVIRLSFCHSSCHNVPSRIGFVCEMHVIARYFYYWRLTLRCVDGYRHRFLWSCLKYPMSGSLAEKLHTKLLLQTRQHYLAPPPIRPLQQLPCLESHVVAHMGNGEDRKNHMHPSSRWSTVDNE